MHPTLRGLSGACLDSSRLFPLLQLRGAEKGGSPSPAAIPAAFSLSGGRYGSGEGNGPRNRRADVYSLGSCPPRIRFCSSPLLGGGARVCAPVVAGGAWVPSVGGEAVATAALWNKSSRTRPRPCGVSLRRHWWVCGGGAPVVELLFQGS